MKNSNFIVIVSFLAAVLSSCGSIKPISSEKSTVIIATNVKQSEISDKNRVVVTNLKGESVSNGSTKVDYNEFNEYGFLKNEFSKKRRTLIVSHPYYKSDTIVIRRTLRPGVFTLDLLGALTLYLSPSLIIDFSNGNIWKVKKSDKNQNVQLTYNETGQNNAIATFEGMMKNHVEKLNIGGILSAIQEHPEEPYISISKNAKNECLDAIFSKTSTIITEFNSIKSTKNYSTINPENLNFLIKYYNRLNSFDSVKFASLPVITNQDVILNSISNLFCSQLRDSAFHQTRTDYKSLYESKKYNYSSAVDVFIKEIDIKQNLLRNQSKLDSIYNSLQGYNSFKKEWKQTLQPVQKCTRKGYKKNDTYITTDDNDPLKYVYNCKFDTSQMIQINFTVPNHFFKGDYVVVKFDFPDERGYYTTEWAKDGTPIKDDVVNSHVYYKYFKGGAVSYNNQYSENNRKVMENEENSKKINRNDKLSSTEKMRLENQVLQTTGSLHKNKKIFSIGTGKGQMNIDALLNYVTGYSLSCAPVNLIYYKDIYNQVEFELYDFGEGWSWNNQVLENLYLSNPGIIDLGDKGTN
jgi:hypothetical protein